MSADVVLGLAVSALVMSATLMVGTVTLLRVVARDMVTAEQILVDLRRDVDLLLAERGERIQSKPQREAGVPFTKVQPDYRS